MLDPTLNVRKTLTKASRRRHGAIMPLFAVTLPLILIFAGFAINLAYMQLVSTELKIATDTAAHAGGRAMSIWQSTDKAIEYAEQIIQTNRVGGKPLTIGEDGSADQAEVVFGKSIRADNGYGMYDFSEVSKGDIDKGNKTANSVGVISNSEFAMVFNFMDTHSFNPYRRSIATQVDRDIALVLDRSGSMLYFKDETALSDTIDDLYNSYETIEHPERYKYRYWRWKKKKKVWQDKGMRFPEDANSNWQTRPEYPEVEVVPGEVEVTDNRLISADERSDALEWLYDRTYSDNVIYQLEKLFNPSHTLGDSYSSSESSQLTSPMAIYTSDWKYEDGAPRYSRWYFLELGVDAFLDVLETTDQDELVSLVTFNYEATLDIKLVDNYDDIRDEVADINPTGGTAIGEGMLTGLPPIISGEAARPFAAKTIVVLTDGSNNYGENPEDAVKSIVADHAVTIHTVTFTQGADEDAMKAVANAGGGSHYHTDDGLALVQIFEEIANNLPTILTE